MTALHLDHESCYRAVASRDERFDGQFFTAVRTTMIYCRPSCPAATPHRGNVSFVPTAAAAQALGYRACKRCHPEAAPGSPEWNLRGDVVARAVRLVADGEVERSGVAGVAGELGYSPRQLNRVVGAELGAGLLALARSFRAQTAAALLAGTDLPIAEVAWASGFGSVRAFNDTIGEVFAATPSQLRGRGKSPGPGGVGELSLRLPMRQPVAAPALLQFLGERALPGVEHWDGRTYQRTLELPRGWGVVALAAGDGVIHASLRLQDNRDLATAVTRLRRLLDADADPLAVAAVLQADPHLNRAVRAVPGRRSPGSPQPFESLVRAIAGQQVSVAGARTVVSRIVARCGATLPGGGPLTHIFPSPRQLAEVDPAELAMPRRRAGALIAASAGVADGRIQLGAGADPGQARAALLALPGIGPWTVDYLAMRGFGDPDVFLPGDLGVRAGLARLGMPSQGQELLFRAEQWRPWRSYAVHYLWQSASGRVPQ